VPEKIVVTGLRPDRLQPAEEFGADIALDVSQHHLMQHVDETHFQPDLAIIATPLMAVTEAEYRSWCGRVEAC
jgi:threonine dehydrogenase-like Zn-dependent dehydrogenase